MAYSVIDQNGKVVAGDAILDDALREVADRYPGGTIRDNATGETMYESDDEERRPPSIDDLIAHSDVAEPPQDEA